MFETEALIISRVVAMYEKLYWLYIGFLWKRYAKISLDEAREMFARSVWDWY
jgi:hypothetical protein